MCKFSSKSGGVPFQPLGDLTWNDPKPIIGTGLLRALATQHFERAYVHNFSFVSHLTENFLSRWNS